MRLEEPMKVECMFVILIAEQLFCSGRCSAAIRKKNCMTGCSCSLNACLLNAVFGPPLNACSGCSVLVNTGMLTLVRFAVR